MCGIIAIVATPRCPSFPPWPFWRGSAPQSPPASRSGLPPHISDILPSLERRGPDATFTHIVPVDDHTFIQLAATTLSLRGPPSTSPHFHPAPNPQSSTILLFNGQIYHGFPPHQHLDAQSDTCCLHGLLTATLDAGDDPLPMLDALCGPWSLIIWHAPTRRLYFGRDRLGRRSLLLQFSTTQITITSAAPSDRCDFIELPPLGLAYLDFSDPAGPTVHVHRRPSHPVLPPRPPPRSANALISGSPADMYQSFLPISWLRTQTVAPSISSSTIEQSATTLHGALHRAVQLRLQTSRPAPRFALLFSGGLDSAVLAVLLHETLPPNEALVLINVAFGDTPDEIAACADRKSALSAHTELQQLCNPRSVRLICADVSAVQARTALETRVSALIRPCDRPMDATIGTALWCAAEAAGSMEEGPRILFSGLGADELLAGYKGRHRTAFANGGKTAVAAEMDADLSRLWFRNLGRDDRLVADHGRELRHPFLDEDVISFVTALPISHVCDLSAPDGKGDKAILRRVAHSLGLSDDIAERPKRAMQFGSRSKQVIERRRKTTA